MWGFRLHRGICRFRVTAFISLKPMKQSCDECRRCSVTVINRRDFLIILLVSQLDKLRQNKTGFDLWISGLKAGQALLYSGSFEIVWLVGVLFWVVLLDNVCVFLSDCICVRVRQCEFACPSAHVRICEYLWLPAHPLCARVGFYMWGANSVKFCLCAPSHCRYWLKNRLCSTDYRQTHTHTQK